MSKAIICTSDSTVVDGGLFYRVVENTKLDLKNFFLIIYTTEGKIDEVINMRNECFHSVKFPEGKNPDAVIVRGGMVI